MTAGPYSIGSDQWPGLAKLAEECGEVIQVVGKIIAANGETAHWDGSDLRQRLEDEVADMRAAAEFLVRASGLDADRMVNRTADKLATFQGWHREHSGKLPADDDPREPCRGFRWIGQSFASCDGCGKPAWEHEGLLRLREGAVAIFGGSEDDYEVQPWKPGEAEAIERKWGAS